jgi:predicted DCC family thiol-disulfide oxidoreductase YuxK
MAGTSKSGAASAGPSEASEEDPEGAKLTVLYDETCSFCRRCRDWLLGQPCFIEVELLAAGSPPARERYGTLPWLGRELVAVDQAGRAWVGPAAFLTCLWATVRYRPWAYRLSQPGMAPLAERFFRFVSRRRDRWSSWLGRDDPECSWCEQNRLWWEDPSVEG